MLIIVFFGSLIRPAKDDWSTFGTSEWELHSESILGQLTHKGIGPNKDYFADEFYSEVNGIVSKINVEKKGFIEITDKMNPSVITNYQINECVPIVKVGDEINIEQSIYKGSVINKVFYIDMARLLLLALFLTISILVYIAYIKRKRINPKS